MTLPVIVPLAASFALLVLSFPLWKKLTTRRLVKPVVALAVLLLAEAITTLQGNTGDPVIQYAITWPERAALLWFVIEILRMRWEHGKALRGAEP